MAGESPPYRASPRPLAGVLGCLTAACAPAVVVAVIECVFRCKWATHSGEGWATNSGGKWAIVPVGCGST
jgi:hypothetical protein